MKAKVIKMFDWLFGDGEKKMTPYEKNLEERKERIKKLMIAVAAKNEQGRILLEEALINYGKDIEGIKNYNPNIKTVVGASGRFLDVSELSPGISLIPCMHIVNIEVTEKGVRRPPTWRPATLGFGEYDVGCDGYIDHPNTAYITITMISGSQYKIRTKSERVDIDLAAIRQAWINGK